MQILLKLEPLQKAVTRLEESIQVCQSRSLHQQHPELTLQLEAGAIQAFEFTYTLSFSTIKRYVEISEADSNIVFDGLSFGSLIRTASEKGLLLNDITVWKKYREARNNTSHTYNQDKAAEVLAIIPAFLEDVKYLLLQLQKKIKNL